MKCLSLPLAEIEKTQQSHPHYGRPREGSKPTLPSKLEGYVSVASGRRATPCLPRAHLGQPHIWGGNDIEYFMPGAIPKTWYVSII